MLSRNNKILIGCLALLLVMSVGYALFSDTIEINGSATAKGDFELTTTCDEDISEIGWINTGSVTDAKISCESNVVNASATLDYPGTEKWFRIMVTNTGTIPAKLKEVVELNNPDEYYCRKDDCPGFIEHFTIYKTDVGQNMIGAYLFHGYDFNDYQDGEINSDNLFDSEQFDAVLDPGETAYFYIDMSWDSNSKVQSPEPLTTNLNVELSWEQVTE